MPGRPVIAVDYAAVYITHMGTTTIRARTATRDRLADLGRRRGLNMPDLLDELIDAAESAELLAAANDHFAAHRDERDAEVNAWDGTAGDGLAPE